MKNKGIRKKLTQLIIVIVIFSMIAVAGCSLVSMLNMREKALTTAKNDAVTQLTDLASGKAELADSMLVKAQSQTLLVAEGMEKIISNSDSYLRGYSSENLPNLTCAQSGDDFVKVIAPQNLLTNIEKDENGNIVKAELNRSADLGGKFTVDQELYFGGLLKNELSQIYHFRTEGKEDEYKGFAASYFCFADSGFDIIGDPKKPSVVSFDARAVEGDWYQGTVKAYKENKLTDAGVFWTEPKPDAAGRGTSMKCAAPVVVNGELVGVAGSGGLINDFADLVNGSKIGSTGYSFMISRDTSKIIINPESKEKSEVYIQKDLSESKNAQLKKLAKDIKSGKSGTIDNIIIDGKKCYAAYSALKNNDWTMVTVISQDDQLIMNAYNQLNNQVKSAFIVFFILIVVLIALAVLITSRYSKKFTNPIEKLTSDVAKIGDGNFDYTSDIKTGDEIESLSGSFEKMTVSLKQHIENLTKMTAENERIGTELNVATNIQASMLPCIFPAFPERDEFDVYATMNPAKEVGGDFYDFFMVDDTHIAIVMADVSGKGVPAALFMVIAKTLIKDHTMPNVDLGEVFTNVNELLCESNSGALFVTAFEAVLDIVTGELRYVNAGHEIPFICKKDGGFEPYKIRSAFVLAGMEGMNYKSGSIQLEPGDKIFQYTDGVTEATNKDNKLYGMDRLEKILTQNASKAPSELLPLVKADIDEFVGDAPQFDDITMLCLEYKKKGEKKDD